MTYETFLEITEKMQQTNQLLEHLLKHNVDLVEFVDPWESIISKLLTEIYGKEGYDWFSWFCYENDFGEGGVAAWDENDNPICYDVKSTWEFLETNYNKQKQ